MSLTNWIPSAFSAALLSLPAFSQSSWVEGFDGGSSGGFTGNALFEATGGNPDGNAHHFVTAFFPSLRTGGVNEPVNSSFIGDFSGFDQVTFALDIKVDSITDFIGNQIFRPVGIMLIDRDIQGPSGPSGVYFDLAVLGSTLQPNWTHLQATIDDPTSANLPTGWIGFGDEDPVTFAPILPSGATFATVLAGVDEFHVTGAAPGFFFSNANFDVRIDNVEVEVTSGSIGTSYCTPASPNSTGAPASITALGSTSVAANDVTLAAQGLPTGQFAFFLASKAQGSSTPGSSQGVLCLSGSIGRFNAPGQVFQGPTGSIQVDLTSIPVSPAASVQPGETWNFQLWYRDNNPGPTSNFSDGLAVTFQ
jgi:hypothetical protein